MTTTYAYHFSDMSQVVVQFDETSASPSNSPPNACAVTSITGTWQGSTITGFTGNSGTYSQDAGGIAAYDNSIFLAFGTTGDGANSLGNFDGIDTAGLLFTINDGNGTSINLNWDGSSTTAFSWTSIVADPNTPVTGNGTSTLSGFTACYAAGTRILTVKGEVAVETLRPGDRVVTLGSFGLSDVRWIGHRRVDVARHPRKSAIAPVRIRAQAFAPGRPHHDLLLSPDHALFVDGVLIPVRYLVNGATIAQESVDTVTYYHIELDRHDVLLAEGMPAESYLDTGNRGTFANGGTTVHAHPDFALKIWEAQSCAPLVTGGALIERLRKVLLDRARDLGHGRVTDSGLCVVADGHPLAVRHDGARLVVDLPPGTLTVRLASRSMVPAWIVPESIDHRRLGVAVQDISVDGVALPATCFGHGWHRAEPGLRWTDGDARLSLGEGHLGGQLTFKLLPLLSYWDTPIAAPAQRAAA